jgi:hypothetical protein
MPGAARAEPAREADRHTHRCGTLRGTAPAIRGCAAGAPGHFFLFFLPFLSFFDFFAMARPPFNLVIDRRQHPKRERIHPG